MARVSKAVATGNLRRQPARNCHRLSSAEAAVQSDVAKPGIPMDAPNTKPKRTPRRAAKDRFEEEKLMTSDKSQLVDLDLVRLLALPEAWDRLEESEKKEILDFLPSDIHPHPHPPLEDPDAKIPPIPESFLRYSNHWRDAIRHFQLDLQNGRYDPQWQREAEEAVQQRAAGKYDNFKEQEFEEFWGQKQKMDRSLAAGQSSQIKVSTLIEHGVIRKGDVWRFSRGFSKGQKILVEKEARIIEVNGSRLTFAVPSGQRVFLKAIPSSEPQSSWPVEKPELGPTTPPSSPSKDPPPVDADSDAKDAAEIGSSKKRSPGPEIQGPVAKRPQGRPRKQNPALSEKKACSIAVEIGNIEPQDGIVMLTPSTKDNIQSPAKSKNSSSQPLDGAPMDVKPDDEKSSPPPPATNEESDEVIIPDIRGPTALTLKILDVDGRIKDAPHGNAWKEIRCFRDNQDMGTLWEVRQAWYLRDK